MFYAKPSKRLHTWELRVPCACSLVCACLDQLGCSSVFREKRLTYLLQEVEPLFFNRYVDHRIHDDEWWVWHPIYSGMSRVFRLLSSMVGFEPTPQSQCLIKQAFLTIRPRRNLWMTHSLSIPSLHLPLAAAHITCVALNEKNSNLFYGNRHHMANQRTHVIFSSFIINHLIFVKELLHDLWLMTNIRHTKHISLWYIYWFGA